MAANRSARASGLPAPRPSGLAEDVSPACTYNSVESPLLHPFRPPYTHGMAWAGFKDPEQGSVPGFDPKTEKYVRLDLDRWLTDHDVLRKAEEQGKANQPPSDASGLDGTESQIVTWINYRGRRCREDVARHLSDFDRELAHLEDDQELVILGQEVQEAKRNAELGLERRVREGRNGLAVLANEVFGVRKAFEAFREDAGLTRPPDYSHRSTAWMFILGCALAEIVLNASLLMEVLPTGLLGAIGQMILISGVNVVIFGLPAGELLRHANHRRWSRTAFCWAALVVVALLVVAFNLAVGHFRDSIQAVLTDRGSDVFQIGANALDRLIDNPMGLDSFHSVLLVLLGMSCFGISSWKWLRRDDAYPEYGPRDRQLKMLEKGYVRQYDHMQEQLAKLYRSFESRLEDIRHKIRAKQSNFREICGRGTRLVEEFPVNMEQYQHDLDYLLNAYRTANRLVRTSSVPPHFETQVAVDSAILKPPSFSPPSATAIQNVMDQVHAAIGQLQISYSESCGRFRPLDEISAGAAQKGSKVDE